MLAWKVHPQYDLLVVANRDEHHARPTAPLDFWHDTPGLLAGRDLVAGGTWLAARDDGRFAAVTNFRDETVGTGLRSRGELVMRFFDSGCAPYEFASQLAADKSAYAGFNLIIGDSDQLCYASNRTGQFAQRLEPGLHALSNHRLGTPWPKVTQGLRALRANVDAGHNELESLFAAMLDQKPLVDPDRDADARVDLPWPASSGPFIAGQEFGTRATTLLWRMCPTPGAQLTRIEERRFGPLGKPDGRTSIALGAGAGA
ncbi:MAG: NRDE family protein [Pseudomonadota bacterium]